MVSQFRKDLDAALFEWETSKHMFVEADGVLPAPDLEGLALVDMLPAEINIYVTMHMDLPEYDTLQKLRRLVLKYTQVLLSQKRKSTGLHLLRMMSARASSHRKRRIVSA